MNTFLRNSGIAVACLIAPWFSNLNADEFSTVASKIDSKLEASLKELSELQSTIAKKKIPLSKDIATLESDVIAKRREVDRQQRMKDNESINLDTLKKQAKFYEEQNEFLSGLLNEFVRGFEGQLHVSENELYLDKTAAARLALGDVNLSEEEKMNAQFEVVGLALERLEQNIGGKTYGGKAIAADGTIVPGKFAAIGPAVYFSTSDGVTAGLTESRINAAEAVVVALPGDFQSGISKLVNSGSGTIAADATLGKAVKMEQTRETYFEHIEKGRVVGYTILGLGLFALAIGLFKFIEITGFSTPKADQVKAVIDQLTAGNRAGAMESAKKLKGISKEMLTAGIEFADEKRGTLEEILYEKILKVRPNLERLLPFLAITAAAAPLMGLLGTVIGMIKTFNLITLFGTGDAKSLSSGISEALVTTELGLTVAIPILILHGMLSRLAKRKLGAVEQAAVAFINGVTIIKHGGGKVSDELPKEGVGSAIHG